MNPDLNQIEGDILVGLSDFIPRNQNQITDLIHKDRKKSTDRVHVHRALKKLEPYLERSRNQLDELGKRWVLKKDIDTLRQIVKEYPSTVPDLQKNNEILSMLENNDFLDSYVGILRDLLRLSSSFFESYLIQDSFFDDFTEIMIKLIYEHSYYSEENNRFGRAYLKYGIHVTAFQEEHYHFILFEMFRHSLIKDHLKGCLNPEAISFYQENKGHLSLEQLQAWDKGIDFSQEPIINPESVIEHVFDKKPIADEEDSISYSYEELEKESIEKRKQYNIELMSNPYL